MTLLPRFFMGWITFANRITAGRFAMLFLLFGVFAVPAFAQQATIVGTVTDSSGAVVPNANITVTNTNTGQIRKLLSNEVGQYVAEALPIGNYEVKAQASGFVVAQTTGLVLNVGDRRRVDFNLK